jgi:hypothetical protein
MILRSLLIVSSSNTIKYCIIFFIFFLTFNHFSLSYQFPYLTSIQEQFESSFHEKCMKYPFVSSFIHKFEYPGDRYLMFVFEEHTLNNGGLGDRLAGLVSAVAMSLRFNRTLVLRDQSQTLHR